MLCLEEFRTQRVKTPERAAEYENAVLAVKGFTIKYVNIREGCTNFPQLRNGVLHGIRNDPREAFEFSRDV